MANMKYDVLGLGVTAVDDLVYVPEYPPADAKQVISDSSRQCGGLTATALVAAARVGAKCAYAGCLGDDDLSRFVLERMRAEGIDVTHVVKRPEARPVHAVIVVAEMHHTRNIFFDIRNVFGADPERPDADLIRSARVLFVDPFGTEGMIRATRIARQANIPVVADIENHREPRCRELLAVVDHLIISQDFATKTTGQTDPAAAVRAMWNEARKTVVVTCGANGCWYTDHPTQPPHHLPAFKVNVVDTTGCGDVFHGAYAAALARGLDLHERIRFSSATAAIKATAPGGQSGIPTRAAVEAFLGKMR